MHNAALSQAEAKIISDYVLAGIRRNGRKTVTYQTAADINHSVSQAKAAQQPTATRLQSLRDQIASLRLAPSCLVCQCHLPIQLDQQGLAMLNGEPTPKKRWFAQRFPLIAGRFARLIARLCSLFVRSYS